MYVESRMGLEFCQATERKGEGNHTEKMEKEGNEKATDIYGYLIEKADVFSYTRGEGGEFGGGG